MQEQQKKSKHEKEKQSGKVRERKKGIANWKANMDVILGTLKFDPVSAAGED